MENFESFEKSLNPVRGFCVLRTRDQFYELKIILITFLSYWLGGSVGGAALAPTGSRDQFHNFKKNCLTVTNAWRFVVREFCRRGFYRTGILSSEISMRGFFRR